MERLKNDIVTVLILIGLALLSLEFVNWICHMAFENTCIELEEQYLTTEISEVIENVENSINFGKTLDNYYGMNEVLDRVENLSEDNLNVAVLDYEGKPLYLSFDDSGTSDLAGLYGADFQQELKEVAQGGEKLQAGSKSSLVFPIYENETELTGYMAVLYHASDLIGKEYYVNTQTMLLVILEIVSVLLMLFLTSYFAHKEEKTAKYAPVAVIMAGMFCYILFLFFTYRGSYHSLVEKKAWQAAVSIQETVEGLLDKGLDADQLYRIGGYLEEKEQTVESIQKITLLTDKKTEEAAEGQTLLLDIDGGSAYLKAEINQQYISEKISLMALTFGAVFAVCLMLTYELTNLVKVLTVRISEDFNKKNRSQYEGLSAQIRILSFLTYTAIYTSTPYAAVLMRSWDATVFGLSKAVSASLPLTVELVSVLAASAVIQKVYKNLRPGSYMIFVFPFLILGNLACMTVSSPYLLIGLRVFCGIGFAFAKYWLNNIVASGSSDDKSFSINCGRLNAGLLGGITIGSSLGSIFAQALGYQANYMFTAIILVLLCVWAVFTMPWKMLAEIKYETAKAQSEAVSEAENTEPGNRHLGGVSGNPKMLFSLVFGCVPLNVGLMYVVAFIPSYMNNIGQDAVATSYVYLVNGLAGVYLGMAVLNLLKKKSLHLSASIALIMAAGGMLLLLVSNGLGVVMLSAAVLGLFDGFGTPSITSHFTGLAADKSETAGMLTVFNMVGSAVQILCPMLYNMMIQPDGSKTYLAVFGVVYLVMAVMFFVTCRPQKRAAA